MVGSERARLRYLSGLLKKNPRLLMGPVVHHAGIQRSGTNFLRTVLEDRFGIRVSNAIDPSRDHPRHKHFRLQDNMDSVVMDTAYRHRHTHANPVAYLDAVAPRLGPAPGQCVVIFKDPVNWLESIVRWGVRCHWVETEAEVLTTDAWRPWLEEYLCYYEAWHRFAQAEPGLVMLVQYEALIRQPEVTMAELSSFLNRPVIGEGPAHVSQVAQSAERDADRLARDCVTTPLEPSLVSRVYEAADRLRLGIRQHVD